MDNQAAIRRCTKPHPSPGQHLSQQIIENLQTILAMRPNTSINIQLVPGHAEVLGNEIADRCAKQAAELPQQSWQSFTSVAYIKRQIQHAGLKEWQSCWQANTNGSFYCNITKGLPQWGPTWKPTKLPNTDQTTASTIHQLHLEHGYFKSYLIRLPTYDSTRCHCSEPQQTAKHLLLGCSLYKKERERAGIQRETTLQGLLFTQKGITALTDFIQETWIATRK